MPEEAKHKPAKYDVDGYDIVTNALKDLLNLFPGLLEGENIKFSTLKEDSGISFYPISGAVIATETTSVTGKVNQLCNYPFYVVYRTAADSQNSKIDIKEFLDKLGKWLEQQPVMIDGKQQKLSAYPDLTEGREVTEISRQTPAYLDNTSEGNVQDWVISLALKYRNIFYRNK